MRTVVMLICLLVAGTCHAEDPLETLNTVEDTLSTMERTLHNLADRRVEEGAGTGSVLAGQSARQEELTDQELYFVSDEPLETFP